MLNAQNVYLIILIHKYLSAFSLEFRIFGSHYIQDNVLPFFWIFACMLWQQTKFHLEKHFGISSYIEWRFNMVCGERGKN